MTWDEQVQKAVDCFDAGARILHIHVRDPKTGKISKNIAEYGAQIARLRAAVPDMVLQVGGSISFAPDGDDVAPDNWDSEFVDSPETLDIARNTRGHLGFGHGVHQCIGANLARGEMQVAFATLARRLPGLRLAVPPDQLTFKDADIYGMKELPVTW